MCSNFLPRIIRTIQTQNFHTTILLNKKKIYTKNEEWLIYNYESIQLGITQIAKNQCEEIVHIEFIANKGDIVNKEENLVIIESVKATESVKAPFDCILLANNNILEDDLKQINEKPEETWLVKIDNLS